jgi:hypothetical protein
VVHGVLVAVSFVVLAAGLDPVPSYGLGTLDAGRVSSPPEVTVVLHPGMWVVERRDGPEVRWREVVFDEAELDRLLDERLGAGARLGVAAAEGVTVQELAVAVDQLRSNGAAP